MFKNTALFRFNNLHRFLIALCIALTATTSLADWSGKGEAGLVVAKGNTETETGNVKVELANEVGAFKHSVGIAALYASIEGDKTAERWELYGQSDYNLSARTFAFGSFRYEQDEFSGFDNQISLAFGMGQKFIDSERTKLVGTAGIGYKILETDDVEDALGNIIEEGERENEAILKATLDLDHALTDTTTILNAFIVESGSSNTYAENTTSLQVKMSDKLALAVGFTVRHNSEPPAGFVSTDKLTTINLVYEID